MGWVLRAALGVGGAPCWSWCRVFVVGDTGGWVGPVVVSGGWDVIPRDGVPERRERGALRAVWGHGRHSQALKVGGGVGGLVDEAGLVLFGEHLEWRWFGLLPGGGDTQAVAEAGLPFELGLLLVLMLVLVLLVLLRGCAWHVDERRHDASLLQLVCHCCWYVCK